MELDWRDIRNGFTWEALMQTLLQFIDPRMRVYTRPGRDWAIDAVSGDGTTVYQAKHHQYPTIAKTIQDAKDEQEKIEGYKKEKPYWASAKNWVLFTNLEINPDDEHKWLTTIEPIFKSEGIAPSLFHLGIIAAKLTEHPAVKLAFFSSEPRIFQTLSDEMGRQKLESCFPEALDVPYVGRNEALRQFDAFLQSNKKIWVISGPGGMGKSRFLLEAAIRAGAAWNAYWSTAINLRHSSLYEAIVPERKTLLFLDDFADIDLLTERLIGELLGGRMKEWKIVLADRLGDSRIIRLLSEKKYEKIADPSFKLSKLNSDDGETLIKSLIVKLQDKRPEVNFKDSAEEVTKRLFKISRGIPLWVGLCLNLIEKDGGLGKLPDESEKLLKKYLDLAIVDLSTTEIHEEAFRKLLSWTALYGRVDTQNKDQILFISKQCGLSRRLSLNAWEMLVNKGLAIRIGGENRFIEIAPDSIRDQILIASLIDVDDRSEFANDVLHLLLTQKVPEAGSIIRNLALIEISQESATDDEIDLLSPIVREIRTAAESGTTKDQLRVLEIVKDFGFSRPKEAVMILEICWRIDRGVEEHRDKLFGQIALDHGYVKRQIPWALFRVAQYARDKEEQEAVYDLFMELLQEEIAHEEATADPGKDAKSLFNRMLFGEYWSERFRQLSEDKLDRLFDEIEIGEDFGMLEQHVFDFLLKGLTAAERVITGPSFSGTISWGKRHVTPKTAGWLSIEKYKNRIKANLKNDRVDVALRRRLAVHYSEIFPGVFRAALPEKDFMDTEIDQLIDDFYVEEVKWLKSYFEEEKISQDLTVRNTLRKVWEWHLKCSTKNKLKKLSQECEDVFFIDDEHRAFEELFNPVSRNSESIETNTTRWLENKSKEQIIEFLQNAAKYCNGDKDLSVITNMAHYFGTNTTDQALYEELRDEFLSNAEDRIAWNFGVSLVEGYVKNIRQLDMETAVAEIRQCLLIAADRFLFLRQYCVAICLHDQPKREDLTLFLEYQPDFECCETFWTIMAFFTFCLWDDATGWIDGVWEDIPEDLRVFYLNSFFHNAILTKHLWQDRYDFEWDSSKTDWILDKMRLLVQLEWLKKYEYELETTFDLKGVKSVKWLLKTVNDRKLSLRDEFVMPCQFRLSYFVSADFSIEEERSSFTELIDMVGERTPLGEDLTRYLRDIDPEGEVLGEHVVRTIERSKVLEDVYWVARIAGEFRRDTKVWRDIALAACKFAQGKDKDTRFTIYEAINWNGSTGGMREYGTVFQYVYDQLHESEDGKKRNIHPEMNEYWEREVEKAQKDLAVEEDKVKVELDE